MTNGLIWGSPGRTALILTRTLSGQTEKVTSELLTGYITARYVSSRIHNYSFDGKPGVAALIEILSQARNEYADTVFSFDWAGAVFNGERKVFIFSDDPYIALNKYIDENKALLGEQSARILRGLLGKSLQSGSLVFATNEKVFGSLAKSGVPATLLHFPAYNLLRYRPGRFDAKIVFIARKVEEWQCKLIAECSTALEGRGLSATVLVSESDSDNALVRKYAGRIPVAVIDHSDGVIDAVANSLACVHLSSEIGGAYICPLVSAYCEKPFVLLSKQKDAKALINEGAGFVAGQLDQLTNALSYLAKSPDMAFHMGQNAFQNFLRLNYRPEAFFEEIMK